MRFGRIVLRHIVVSSCLLGCGGNDVRPATDQSGATTNARREVASQRTFSPADPVERLPPLVAAYSKEIDAKGYKEAVALAVTKFGPPTRDTGSGVAIKEWDVAGGVLSLHPSSGASFQRGKDTTHFPRAANLVLDSFVGSWEMTRPPDAANRGTRRWIGNVALSADGSYRFTSAFNDRNAKEQSHFFSLHPQGTFKVALQSGLTNESLLQDLPGIYTVATVTFSPAGSTAATAYQVSSDSTSLQLTIADPTPVFLLNKSWPSRWK